jgi:oxygen-dependent protoporphyrinogen oxidase
MPRLIVVGGGLAGLAALHHARASGVEAVLLEASDRVGGLVRTEMKDGFVIDRGPESILADKPAAVTLAEKVGLEPEIIRTIPDNRGAFVVHGGRLERVPEGFSLIAPTNIPAFLASPVFSARGKARALLDLVLPRGPVRADESLASFVERRLGREVLDRIAQPMVGGIYGAHPSVLSLGATMPRFLAAERAHGSVIRGLRRTQTEAAQGARYGLFVSFREGMGALTEALGRALDAQIRTSTSVVRVARTAGLFRVTLANGEVLTSEALVLAASAKHNARLVEDLDGVLARDIGSVPHGSAAIVTFVFRKDRVVRPLNAYGYVTPSVEGRRVIASTWSSSKWPGRAPEGYALVRFFLGRAGDDALAHAPEEELVALARADAAALMGATGKPELVRVDRALDAMPRFVVGHLDTVQRIEARVAAIPGLGLAGAFLRGVGMPDTVASAERAVVQATRTGT